MFMRKFTFFLFFCLSFNLLAVENQPNLGRHASKDLIKQWDIDIFIDGKGLPKGEGTVLKGKEVYEKYCLSCHGVDGSGDSADELAGAMHSLTDNSPDKIIGTYWPYATTIFDFTRRSMPLDVPGILNNNQLYAVTAYLLYLNGIIKRDKVINSSSLPKVNMPNRRGFINIYQQEIEND